MSGNKKTEYYLIQPFEAGEVELSQLKKESEQTVIIDTLSRDDILYCAEGCYLITEELFKSLKDSGLTGVNVVKPKNIKFSAKHNIDYPNQTMPDFTRLIVFPFDESKSQEMFLNKNNNLVINSRMKRIFDNHRTLRCKKYDYTLEEVNEYDDFDLIENPVFKKEKNNKGRNAVIFSVVIISVMMLFFHFSQ